MIEKRRGQQRKEESDRVRKSTIERERERERAIE